MKHTPGPWTATDSTSSRPPNVDSSNGRIANIYWQGGAEQAKANARLIAAAPTLYEFVLSRADSGSIAAKELLASLDVSK